MKSLRRDFCEQIYWDKTQANRIQEHNGKKRITEQIYLGRPRLSYLGHYLNRLCPQSPHEHYVAALK